MIITIISVIALALLTTCYKGSYNQQSTKLPDQESFYRMNEKPNMKELNVLHGRGDQKEVRIIQGIGVDYHTVGTNLLNDDDGAIMPTIKEDERGKTEAIITEVFRRWLAGKGRKPVSWGTLVHVLRNIAQLTSLADEIITTLEATRPS